MKATLFLVVLFTTLVNAQDASFMMQTQVASAGVAASGGGCSTVQTNYSASVSAGDALYGYGPDLAVEFTATSSGTLCSVTATMYVGAGSPVGNISCGIWSSTAGSPDTPGSQIGSFSASIAASGVGGTQGSPSTVTFSTWTTAPTLVSGTKYFLVLETDSTDHVNYLKWAINYGHAGLTYVNGNSLPIYTWGTASGYFYMCTVKTQ